MNVSRETAAKIDLYRKLLIRWNPHINLVAPSTLEDVESRHFADCLQVADLVKEFSGNWVDLGSGGGLPGLVIAITKASQKATFTLVESDQRKAAFLRSVVRETGLANVTILAKRIESLSTLNAAYVSARALAPLSQLMAYLALHLSPDGTAFLMKGHRWKDEVEEARKNWNFDYVAHPSRTQDGAAILEVSGVRHGRA